MLVVTEREQLPVAEARAANVEAWESLFRRYRLPLYVYVFELVRDEQARQAVISTQPAGSLGGDADLDRGCQALGELVHVGLPRIVAGKLPTLVPEEPGPV